ncbi:Protein of unknown function [Pyronema omphalodes CBS 100304]|uniref:Secreted protein n=1 Tax=Pyronema omphalodes (strain CBS 100304) TaxID=1076935 RepID=U4LGJ1_PYROM|nr:Protein of unknown function [Pyronema omphalodes CBS 100304]
MYTGLLACLPAAILNIAVLPAHCPLEHSAYRCMKRRNAVVLAFVYPITGNELAGNAAGNTRPRDLFLEINYVDICCVPSSWRSLHRAYQFSSRLDRVFEFHQARS